MSVGCRLAHSYLARAQFNYNCRIMRLDTLGNVSQGEGLCKKERQGKDTICVVTSRCAEHAVAQLH